MKVLTIIGTRPEIIKLSIIIKRLDDHTDHLLVHTGQNFDHELNNLIWQDLGVRKPDFYWNINRVSTGNAVSEIIRKSEEVLLNEKPDALLVLGDTNSCLSAYMAKRMHIPIFHMEAGNRSFDFNVPEEVNRHIIDHFADFNLVYTEHARRHLLSEGLPHRRIYLTGSPMKEVLDYYLPEIDNSKILKTLSEQIQENKNHRSSVQSVSSVFHLSPKKYFVVSVHREENVDNPENLKKILKVLNTLVETYNLPIIVSTHPRTRKRIENLRSSAQSASSAFHLNELIYFMKPFGFLDYIALQKHAKCTISDSGTISEESSILSFPAISLRQSMERPEAQDTGSIILTGFEPEIVLNSINATIDEHITTNKEQETKNIKQKTPQDYTITNTSWRVLKLILGNTKLSNVWHGIK